MSTDVRVDGRVVERVNGILNFPKSRITKSMKVEVTSVQRGCNGVTVAWWRSRGVCAISGMFICLTSARKLYYFRCDIFVQECTRF